MSVSPFEFDFMPLPDILASGELIPQAVIAATVEELGGESQIYAGEDDLDRYKGFGIVVNKIPAAIMRYEGHPPGTVSLYVSRDVTDIQEISDLVLKVLTTLQISPDRLRWQRSDETNDKANPGKAVSTRSETRKNITKVISKLYPTYERAQHAVRDLGAAGVPSSDVSIVANNADNWFSNEEGATKRVDRDGDGVEDRAEGAGKGASAGATVGGAAGLLAGLGLLAIPGVGPVVAAGWLVATAAGAAASGLTGGIIGALTKAGVSEEDAHVYAEGVRRGGTLVTARVDERSAAKLEATLERSALRTNDLRSSYGKSGWKTFDPAARPLTADEVRRERNRYH